MPGFHYFVNQNLFTFCSEDLHKLEEIQAMTMFELHPPFLAFVFLFFVTVFLYRWLFFKKETLKLQPPSPPKLPIIGNLHQLGRDKHISLRSLAQKYGPVMLIHLGSRPALVVSSAATAKEIFKTHDVSFSDKPRTSITDRIFYNGKNVGFAPYSEYWRQVKSMCVLQLLSSKRIQSFRSVRDAEVAQMIQCIKDSPSKVVNLKNLFRTLANNIVCHIVLGKKYEGGKGVELRKLLGEMSQLTTYSGIGVDIPWLYWIDNFNGMKRRAEKVANEVDDFLEGVVTDHIIALETNGAVNQDFVSILLENWKQTTDNGYKDCIKAVTLDMLTPGTNTTSSTLEWTMTMLMRNPDIMCKLQKEVREISRGKTRIFEEDLEKMQYLRAVIKESLRMNTPVPVIPREVRENVKVMGYDIKARTLVLINVFAISRDPTLWDKPEEFRPERFLNSSIDYKGLHFEYLPFGAGRRRCPGIQFGMAVNELALANVVNMFDFELPDGKTTEVLDMAGATGVSVGKKSPLLLVANQHF